MEFYHSEKATVTLNGVTKELIVGQFYENGPWFTETKVVVKFFSGSKFHTSKFPQIYRSDRGTFYFSTAMVRNRRVKVVAFSDDIKGDSLWTKKKN